MLQRRTCPLSRSGARPLNDWNGRKAASPLWRSTDFQNSHRLLVKAALCRTMLESAVRCQRVEFLSEPYPRINSRIFSRLWQFHLMAVSGAAPVASNLPFHRQGFADADYAGSDGRPPRSSPSRSCASRRIKPDLTCAHVAGWSNGSLPGSAAIAAYGKPLRLFNPRPRARAPHEIWLLSCNSPKHRSAFD